MKLLFCSVVSFFEQQHELFFSLFEPRPDPEPDLHPQPQPDLEPQSDPERDPLPQSIPDWATSLSSNLMKSGCEFDVPEQNWKKYHKFI